MTRKCTNQKQPLLPSPTKKRHFWCISNQRNLLFQIYDYRNLAAMEVINYLAFLPYKIDGNTNMIKIWEQVKPEDHWSSKRSPGICV